jgi:hypothetical protein
MKNRSRPESRNGHPRILIHRIGVNESEFRPQTSDLLHRQHAQPCDLGALL